MPRDGGVKPLLRRTWPILLLAFAVGALFRFGNEYSIPVLRMFGTWGIVAIGLVGARSLRRFQAEAGLAELTEALDRLPQGLELQEAPPVDGVPAWLLTSPRGKLLLGGSDVPHSAKGARAARVLTGQAVRLVNGAFNAGLIAHGDRVGAALVLLRKRVNERERYLAIEGLPDPVILVNPDEVDALLQQMA